MVGMRAQPLELELYTAPGCCLCEELAAQVDSLRAEFELELRVVDITASQQLEERFRPQIPVLYLNGRKIAKYRISLPALRDRLRWAQGWRGCLRLR